jgi:hypothetical protein
VLDLANHFSLTASINKTTMSKLGLLGRAIGSLISLVTRIVFWVVQNTSLAVSLALTTYTIGEYTKKFIQDKPKG